MLVSWDLVNQTTKYYQWPFESVSQKSYLLRAYHDSHTFMISFNSQNRQSGIKQVQERK